MPYNPRNKFQAQKTEVDGITFASKRESRRYRELSLLEKSGAISNLTLQVRYPLTINGHTVAHYVADFVYQENGQTIVEDSKGVRTAVYRLKCKLMQAVHGIKIRET